MYGKLMAERAPETKSFLIQPMVSDAKLYLSIDPGSCGGGTERSWCLIPWNMEVEEEIEVGDDVRVERV